MGSNSVTRYIQNWFSLMDLHFKQVCEVSLHWFFIVHLDWQISPKFIQLIYVNTNDQFFCVKKNDKW